MLSYDEANDLLDKLSNAEFIRLVNSLIDRGIHVGSLSRYVNHIYAMNQFNAVFGGFQFSPIEIAQLVLNGQFDVDDKYFCFMGDEIVSFTDADSPHYPIGNDEYDSIIDYVRSYPGLVDKYMR